MVSIPARLLLAAWLSSLWLCWPGPGAAQAVDAFRGFTRHIQLQIQRDKRSFLDAQNCTEWFYRQQKKPRRPEAQGIVFSSGSPSARPTLQSSECPSRYPGGLNAAREDFSSTQSALSLSLTFYQFALVGDRNDDTQYSAPELQDMLESFGLAYDRSRPASAHLAALTTTFEFIRSTGGLERLMTSMGGLYDKGYRLTERDRSSLDQITK